VVFVFALALVMAHPKWVSDLSEHAVWFSLKFVRSPAFKGSWTLVHFIYRRFYPGLRTSSQIAVLSTFYSRDKYGIVILYFLMSLMSLANAISCCLLHFILESDEDACAAKKKDQPPPLPTDKLHDRLGVVLSLVTWVLIKCAMINLIFMNNTGADGSDQQKLHRVFVFGGLGLAHVAAVFANSTLVTTPVAYKLAQTGVVFVPWVAFCFHAHRFGFLPPSVLTALSFFFESLTLGSTIGF